MSNAPLTPAEIADSLQPVIDAVEPLVPAPATAGLKAWIRRYLKGEIALVGTVATLALAYFPAGGSFAHYAAFIVSASSSYHPYP